jgi:nucleoside 2-deoxyribosyltransferase
MIENLEDIFRKVIREELHRYNCREVKSVYLCGAIDFVSEKETSNWRNEATKKLNDLGIYVYDPCFASTIHNTLTIVREDLSRIKKSDVLLVNFSNENVNACGTSMEIRQAYEWGKHIVAFVGERGIHNVPRWLKFHAVITKHLDKAIEYIDGINHRRRVDGVNLHVDEEKEDKKDGK